MRFGNCVLAAHIACSILEPAEALRVGRQDEDGYPVAGPLLEDALERMGK